MTKLKEKRLESTPIFKGRLMDVWLDKVELPNKKQTTREYTKHPGAAAIVPILPDGKLALIRHYRYAIDREQIEIPAGKLDPGESPIQTAARELEEEIGYRPGKLTELTVIHPCVGYSDERIWIYLAEALVPTQTNTDHDEFVELTPTSFEDAVAMVWSGKITDAKSIIGILWAEKVLT